MRQRTTATSLLLAVGLVLAACGGATETDPGTDNGITTTTVAPIDTASTTTTLPPTPPVTEPRLLLRFDATGGFVPVEFALTDLIEFTLYSDGRVIVGSPPGGFPMPAVQRYVETTIDELTLVEFLGLIEQLGIADFDREANVEMQNFVADAETTVLEYFDDDGGVHRYSVYALGMNDFEDADGRVAVMEEIAALVDSTDTSGATEVPIDALQVWVAEVTPDPSYHKVQPWEFGFPSVTAEPGGFNYTCFALSGDDAAQAAAILSKANSATLWDQAGTAYSVLAKPLLAGETGCEDLSY